MRGGQPATVRAALAADIIHPKTSIWVEIGTNLDPRWRDYNSPHPAHVERDGIFLHVPRLLTQFLRFPTPESWPARSLGRALTLVVRRADPASVNYAIQGIVCGRSEGNLERANRGIAADGSTRPSTTRARYAARARLAQVTDAAGNPGPAAYEVMAFLSVANSKPIGTQEVDILDSDVDIRKCFTVGLAKELPQHPCQFNHDAVAATSLRDPFPEVEHLADAGG